jgi:hypothetical protein
MTEKKSAASASSRKGFTAKPQSESGAASDPEAIAKLQADLAAKDEEIAHLKLQRDRAEESAKHLASLNQTLITENEHLKADKEGQKEAHAAMVPTQEKPPSQQSSQLATASQRGINLMHPVFPNGKLPSGMGDQELGWFD